MSFAGDTFDLHFQLDHVSLRSDVLWLEFETPPPCRLRIFRIDSDGLCESVQHTAYSGQATGYEEVFPVSRPRIRLEGDFSQATSIRIQGRLRLLDEAAVRHELHLQNQKVRFASDRIGRMRHELKTTREQARHYRRLALDMRVERDAMRRSWSWFLTSPLRKALHPFLPRRGASSRTPRPIPPSRHREPQPYDPLALVSVAIPVYNGAAYLEETLNSVLNQTHTCLEVVVVDDASSDGSGELVQKLAAKEPRLRYVPNPENLGMVGNWNRAVSLCRGEWVLLMGQDDLLDPDMLETTLRSARPGIGLVLVSRDFCYESNSDQLLRETYDLELPTLDHLGVPPGVVTPELIADQIPYLPSPCTNFLGEPLCGLVRKTVYDQLGSYHPGLSQLADYEFWLRIALREPIVFLRERLATFRVHADALTSVNIRNPVKGIHLESALLLLELLEGPAYADVRETFPDLAQVWEEQLQLDLIDIQRYRKKQPAAEAMIREACQVQPLLRDRLNQTESEGNTWRRRRRWFAAKWRLFSPGLLLRKLQAPGGRP